MADVVRQRCVLVLPSTGEFDSRAHRIATSLVARGHEVTLVARAADGLPDEEGRPAGYRVLRVPVSALDGVPGPLRPIAAAVLGRRARTPQISTSQETASAEPTARPRRAPTPGSRVARAVAAVVRLVAIGLTVRSQGRRTAAVAPKADLVHAMAYMGIPVGLRLGRRDRVPVIYDARDIYVDAANLARLPRAARWLFGRIERDWARSAARVVTVNEPYAQVMAGRFGVEAPLVVLNCSVRRPADPPTSDRLRQRLGLAGDHPIVLYHGGLSPERGIEQLVAGLPDLPGIELVLLGYGRLEGDLRSQATRPAVEGRLHVLPAVPPEELVHWVASADVVAMPIQPTTLNHRLTTPNKLFEAMAAGVPVVASDLPGMAGIVRDTGCGVLVDPTDPAAIAAGIRSILALSTDERRAMGARGLAAHREVYHWDSQAERLLAEYGRLTGKPW